MVYIIKFGGSSLKNKKILENVVEIMINTSKEHKNLITVCSACGETTNKLLSIIEYLKIGDNEKYKLSLNTLIDYHNELSKNNTVLLNLSKELTNICDSLLGKVITTELKTKIVCFGELMSTAVVQNLIMNKTKNIIVKSIDSREVIHTDSNYDNATVYYERTYQSIRKRVLYLDYNILIVPGYIASNNENKSTTLGRGGGDLTASLFAVALKATEVEIWSDCDGIMTSDPRYIKGTQLIKEISYDKLFYLSYYGANIIYYKTIIPLFGKKITTWIKNTYNPNSIGTKLYSLENNNNNISPVIAISTLTDLAFITISGLKIKSCVGFSSFVFEVLSKENINIIAISQESSEFSINICIDKENLSKAKNILEKSFKDKLNITRNYSTNKSVISIIHRNPKYKTKILEELSHLINQNNIPLDILSSGNDITCFVTDSIYTYSMSQKIHDHFFSKNIVNKPSIDIIKKSNNLDSNKVYIFIIGLGKVGSKVFEMIQNLQNFIITGVSNSKGFIFNRKGLHMNIELCQQKLNSKDKILSVYELIMYCKINKTIVIDTTSSNKIVNWYNNLIKQNIPIVVANKKGLSSDINLFKKLYWVYQQNRFFYETTVCAGLPIIQTVSSLIHSNHIITKIEGIFSGTCNYVCSQLQKGEYTFSEIIEEALQKGITEPHPYDDLCGMDVARKILILSRMCSEMLELSDIKVEPFVPIQKKDVREYIQECKEYNKEFQSYSKLSNKTIKYVATYENGECIVGKKVISKEHPFYNIHDTLNIVAIYTNIYTKPLVISGFGAGIEQTASGVVADMLKTCNFFINK